MKNAAALLPLFALAWLGAAVGFWWQCPVPSSEIRPIPTGLKLSLNTASAADLTLLPGVGRAAADRIVADRRPDGHGPFRSPADLLRVRGLSPRHLANIEPYVRTPAD
jgi:competence protein ComEA